MLQFVKQDMIYDATWCKTDPVMEDADGSK